MTAPTVTAPAPGAAGATLLRTGAGEITDGGRWVAPLETADEVALDRCLPPVLDVGCGPGRHTVALGRRGVPALGVDITPAAIEWALPRGALVLHRSVFDRLPGTGRWGTVLLLDGNLGIGGDPEALLRRSAELLAPGGLVVAELDAPGTPARPTNARLEVAGAPGPWFAWDRVPADLLAALAEEVDLAVDDAWERDGRWFAVLRRGRR